MNYAPLLFFSLLTKINDHFLKEKKKGKSRDAPTPRPKRVAHEAIT